MGVNVEQQAFSPQDYLLFQEKLYQQLEQLKEIVQGSQFGKMPTQFGAELEVYLVNNDMQVSCSNQWLLSNLKDKQFQPEINQYNLELNLSPVLAQGTPFTNLQHELTNKLDKLSEVASTKNINIVPIGILPTLKSSHLNQQFMTKLGRYQCLADELYKQRGEAFKININGEQPLSINFNDICSEGANTSFQVHLMVEPEKFNDTFNAALLTAPLVNAVCANSGIFLGNRLWDETRIALFKQSLDIRLRDKMKWQQPTRVNFGFGWLRDSVWQLYAEAVALYPPIMPIIDRQSSLTGLPKLTELCTHMGTLWPWHRPVYDSHGNGHVRIEFRAIPAGPTNDDMAANAAFAIGLAAGMAKKVSQYTDVMPFRFAEYNFYRAAQHGLDAHILWPLHHKYRPEEVAISAVLHNAIDIAAEGLASLGVSTFDIEKYLGIIEHRISGKINGATWQKKRLFALSKTHDKDQACQLLVKEYLQHCRSAMPLATWEQNW